MHNVIQLGETRNYTAAKQAIATRCRRIGAAPHVMRRATAVAIRELQAGRSTACAIALAWSEIGGPRNTRLQPSPRGAA